MLDKKTAVSAALCLPLLIGCDAIGDKLAEKAVELGSGADDVEIDKGGKEVKIKTKEGELELTGDGDQGSATFKGADGSMAKFNQTLPKDFPLPIIEHDKVLASTDIKDKDGSRMRSASVLAKSKDSGEVADFYEAALKKAGLQPNRTTLSSGAQGLVMLSGKDAAGKTDVAIQIMKGAEQPSVQVNIMHKTNPAQAQ